MKLSFGGFNADDRQSQGKGKRRMDESDDDTETSEAEGNDRPLKKTKEMKKKYPYGNYRTYYSYRLKKGAPDPRLACLGKEFFAGKKCLDIGCNNGRLTFQIGYRFDPASMVGVDIDPELIETANQKLKSMIEKKQAKKETQAPFPISFSLVHGALPERQFPSQISFIAQDYLQSVEGEKYDTVLALSVTKWIQLNWGDDGVRKFFQNVHRDLLPGGLFVFEPQEWRSYKKKGGYTEVTKRNYQSIKFKPDQFSEFLMKSLHFTLLATKQPPKDASASEGFERPIYIYQKSV